VAAQLQSGLVWVNTHHRNDPSSPWGGMKESGIGRENGIEAFEACKFIELTARFHSAIDSESSHSHRFAK
jgi:acyl-CoA reductase-like NAD-dependent aldehyde dehydrogenase